MTFWFAIFLACQTVDGDRLRGADLTAANSAFAAIDPAADLGPAPYPGLRRVMHANELGRIAARFHVPTDAPLGEACFERVAVAKSETQAVRRTSRPPEILRGDVVEVEVAMGAALLSFESRAESSGHIGEIIIVRNPENNKLFRARVDAPGKVSVKK
jgi:hypothetical protein